MIAAFTCKSFQIPKNLPENIFCDVTNNANRQRQVDVVLAGWHRPAQLWFNLDRYNLVTQDQVTFSNNFYNLPTMFEQLETQHLVRFVVIISLLRYPFP